VLWQLNAEEKVDRIFITDRGNKNTNGVTMEKGNLDE
jgi:hypothetical protein